MGVQKRAQAHPKPGSTISHDEPNVSGPVTAATMNTEGLSAKQVAHRRVSCERSYFRVEKLDVGRKAK